jgi:hypothetical protein
MAEIVVAAADAQPNLDDDLPRVIYAGVTLADSRHEIVTRYPDLWKPLNVHYAVEEPEPKAPAKTPPPAAASRKASG